ncbi:MAG: 1-acyl-sn-glycerol-3-phosphate acyltransferase [Deltaproteobacteria bacterium]|nr:1-acyl-sn-glycerol-3-phosphate acyltransferase [Deltaproteobacteria bacterium]
MEGAIASPLLKLIEAQLPEKVQIRASSSLSLDLGFDSLTMLDFWNSVQERFRVSIPEETTRELREVGAILQYLQSLPELQGSDFSVDQAFPDGNPQAGLAGILSNPPPEIHQATQEILDSHPRLRPWFLKAFRIFFRGACRLRVQGLENLPAQGPYILAPNHESYLDNIFVACLLPKAAQDDIAVIGAKEFFDKPATRLIAQLCRTIPIEREKFSHAILQMGLDILQRGKILLVHPEGTRSPNGQLLPLKAGVGILASFQGCPVVPVHVEGGYEFWPKDSKFPKSRGPILVSIGKPLMPMRDPTQAKGMGLMESAQDLTRRLRASLISLSEQALVSTKNNSGPEAAGKPLEISEIPSRPRGDL